MDAAKVRGVVLGFTLVFSGCSQQVPSSDTSRINASAPQDLATGDLITDITVHSLAASITEVRYEKPKLFTLAEPFESYGYLLTLSLGSKIVRLGLLQDLSGRVQWFEPTAADIETCLLSQGANFSPLLLAGEGGLVAQATMLSHELRILCDISDEVMNSPVLVMDNTVFLRQVPVASSETSHPSLELESMVISVLGSNLMVHVDDRNSPTFAVIQHYIDEMPVVVGAPHAKRLRTEFSLKNLKQPAKPLFGSNASNTQELIPDPIQSGCTAVRTDWEGEPIYISFKQIPDNHTALLGDLCGVYFSRSKKLYSADAVLGSFIDI